jgi:hypothetical protein
MCDGVTGVKEVFRAGCCPTIQGFFATNSELSYPTYTVLSFLSFLLLACHCTANLFHCLSLLDNSMGVRDSQCGKYGGNFELKPN